MLISFAGEIRVANLDYSQPPRHVFVRLCSITFLFGYFPPPSTAKLAITSLTGVKSPEHTVLDHIVQEISVKLELLSLPDLCVSRLAVSPHNAVHTSTCSDLIFQPTVPQDQIHMVDLLLSFQTFSLRQMTFQMEIISCLSSQPF